MSSDEIAPQLDYFVANSEIESPESTTNFREAARTDFSESDHKLRMVGYIGSTLSVLAINSCKIPLVATPMVALEVLQFTENSLPAGAAAGAVYAAYTMASTLLIDKTLDTIPTTKAWIAERHPAQVELYTNAWPGLESTSPDEPAASKTFARFFKSAVTHSERGITTIGLGANNYVLAAHFDKQPKKEITKLRRRLAVDSGALIGLLALAGAEKVREVSDSNPILAQQIEHVATDAWKVTAAAGAIVVTQGATKWGKNRFKKAKQARLQKNLDLEAAN